MATYLLAIASAVVASVGPACALLLVPTQDFDESSARDATEAGLWSIFQASPKNEFGRLEVEVAALALQSYFSRKRGWQVELGNDEVRGRLRKLNRGGRGFSTRDLVQAVEAFEGLVSTWTLGGLARAYEASNASTTEVCGAEKLKIILESYAKHVVALPAAPHGLPSPTVFTEELLLNFEMQRHSSGIPFTPNQYSFDDAASMVADFMKQLERQRHDICARQSLPQSTCFARTQHHAICCHSLYEAVKSELERKLQAPSVAPELLIRTVSRVSLKSMGVRHCASKMLEKQLFSIAAENGGTVPLHGQAFSEWVLRAFEKDCAPADQPRIDRGARSLALPIGFQDLARVAVAGLIGFAMLRSVFAHLQAANGALHGGSDKQKS